MNTEALANTKIGQIFIRIMAAIMESRFRYRFFGPMQILQGADIQPGQTVLELGCGMRFFTLPAARLLGDQGRLVAMDMLRMSVEAVTKALAQSQPSRSGILSIKKVIQKNSLWQLLNMASIFIFGEKHIFLQYIFYPSMRGGLFVL